MKKSFREQLEANDAAQRHLAAMSGREVPPRFLNNLPPKREIKNHSPANDKETAVAIEVNEVIFAHPKVLFAIRQNSGEADYGSQHNGFHDIRRVRFYEWIKRPPERKVLIPDCWGLLVDGRMFAIEIKHRRWYMIPSDERACKQQNFIDAVIARGGVGGFATCAEAAQAILDRA